jgi:hypothetical protein
MDLHGKEIVLSVQLEQLEGHVAAFCPELNLRDHGDTAEEAEAQLVKSIWLFLRVCAAQGTLDKVLRERGALREGGASGQAIQIPYAALLFESKRAAAQ